MSAGAFNAFAETAASRRRMFALAMAAISGALFGAGLLLGGMTQPAKIIAFLDVTRSWDPSLAFVMGGAVASYALLYRWVLRRRGVPWFDTRFHLPTRRNLDVGLLAGSALFGVGWGLGGFCPGPGLVAAASGSGTGVLFVVAMLVGMLGQRLLSRP